MVLLDLSCSLSRLILSSIRRSLPRGHLHTRFRQSYSVTGVTEMWVAAPDLVGTPLLRGRGESELRASRPLVRATLGKMPQPVVPHKKY